MEQQPHDAAEQLHLLNLPDFLIGHILGGLSSATDLFAAAATCTALRALVVGSRWPNIASFAAHAWTPALSNSLAWGADRFPQLRELDLSGATACSDADLLPLSQLSTLTSLRLAGLWRVTGSSAATSRPGGRRRSGGGNGPNGAQPLDVLAAIVDTNRGLSSLDLGGTGVLVGAGLAAALGPLTAGVAPADRAAHGLRRLRLAGCGPAPGTIAEEVPLGRVLWECPGLQNLDVAECSWLTPEAVEPRDGPRKLRDMPLLRVVFSGCEQMHFFGLLMCTWTRLQEVDLSGTMAGDEDVAHLAICCPALHTLRLRDCFHVKGSSFADMVQLSSVLSDGCLTELRLSELAWVRPEDLGALLCALRRFSQGPLRLDLSSCGGLSDGAFVELLPLKPREESSDEEDGAPPRRKWSSSHEVWPPHLRRTSHRFWLQELRLGGNSRLTTAALARLASAMRYRVVGGQFFRPGQRVGRRSGAHETVPFLRGLEELDLGHVQCLSTKGNSPAGGSSAGSSGGGGGAGTQAAGLAAVLTALFEAAGSSLRRLTLDGCYAGGGVLPALAQHCPALEQLSVVGCGGVGDADMAALCTLRSLRDLSVGGASLAWHEHRALTGLTGLTRLRIARRPYLTDAQLAPLLAANRSSLLRLELAGCASLNDGVLLALLPPAADASGREGAPASKEEGEQLAVQLAGLQLEGTQDGSSSSAGSAAGPVDQQRRAQQQRTVPPPLQHLQLVCCERMTGATLRSLGRLRSLRLSGCPAISQSAVQTAAICLTRLTLLELPGHLPLSSMPVAPPSSASHLAGLRLTGGTEERGGGGRRGRRRSAGG